MTENYFSNRAGYKVAAVRMYQRALFVNSVLCVFFEGKEIEARIKWWNPIQVSRTVPLNALIVLLNEGLIAYLSRYRFYPLSGRRQWVITVYFINRLSVSGYSGTVLYCFWCSTPALGFPLDYFCVFGCATYSSLLEMLRGGKLTPSGVMDMHVSHDLGSSLEEGISV